MLLPQEEKTLCNTQHNKFHKKKASMGSYFLHGISKGRIVCCFLWLKRVLNRLLFFPIKTPGVLEELYFPQHTILLSGSTGATHDRRSHVEGKCHLERGKGRGCCSQWTLCYQLQKDSPHPFCYCPQRREREILWILWIFKFTWVTFKNASIRVMGGQWGLLQNGTGDSHAVSEPGLMENP